MKIDFFNGYYSQPIQVSDDVWTQVYGYFYNITNNVEAANALAQSLLTLTYNNKLNPLDLLQQFQKNPNNSDVKTLLISFFNNIKGSTSKLGYKKVNMRPDSLFANYYEGPEKIDAVEARFWFNTARKECYFKQDRKTKFDRETATII